MRAHSASLHTQPATVKPVLLPWRPGTCRVPMWMGGCPAGFCDKPAFGHQLPHDILYRERGYSPHDRVPYCHGHACPNHGGPRENEPRIFADGYTPEGRQMWCAVNPDFENLQESPAGFHGNPFKARALLAEATTANSVGIGPLADEPKGTSHD